MCEEYAHWWVHHSDAPHECRILKIQTNNINSKAKKPGGILQHHVEAQEQKVMNPKFEFKNLPARMSTENYTRWRARHSNSSHGCRKLKSNQKHQHRSKHNGWYEILQHRVEAQEKWRRTQTSLPEFFPRVRALRIALVDELTTSKFPNDAMNCTSPQQHTSKHQQSLMPNLHTSLSALTGGRTVRSQFSEVNHLSAVDSSRIFCGVLPIRDLIGELANYFSYPTTGNWNFRRPQSSFNTFKWPKGSWFVTQGSGSPLRLITNPQSLSK
jgi:hypothetical protein